MRNFLQKTILRYIFSAPAAAGLIAVITCTVVIKAGMQYVDAFEPCGQYGGFICAYMVMLWGAGLPEFTPEVQLTAYA